MSEKHKRTKTFDWLAAKIKQDQKLCILGSVGLVLLGSFVTFLTFWIIYGIAGFVGPFSHNGLLLFSAIMVVILFIANVVSDREHLDHLEFETGPGVTAMIAIGAVTNHGMAAAFAGPKNFSSFVKILSTLILSGPRLFSLAWKLSQKTLRLRQMNVANCARIIAMLLKKESRVPLASIVAKFPDADPQILIPQLRDIDGVVFLVKEPVGLTISPGLVEEIREWKIRPQDAAEF